MSSLFQYSNKKDLCPGLWRCEGRLQTRHAFLAFCAPEPPALLARAGPERSPREERAGPPSTRGAAKKHRVGMVHQLTNHAANRYKCQRTNAYFEWDLPESNLARMSS